MKSVLVLHVVSFVSVCTAVSAAAAPLLGCEVKTALLLSRLAAGVDV